MSDGIGVNIYRLFGSSESPKKYYGLKINNASIENDELLIEFENKIIIKLYDNGQSCCESRYITCDDNIKDLIDCKLVKIEVVGNGENEKDYEEHEWCFVKISTDESFITITTHVEHNGYYGGFALKIEEVK